MLLCIVMLSASATFATDDTALADASDEIAVEENVLTASEDFASESSNAILADANDNIVTNDTFFNYFNGTGSLLSNVTSDELIFEGEFGGLGIDYIFINKPIVFTGNGDAVFDGITFVVSSDNVTIDGFSIFQKDDYGILIEEDNVVISNNYLEFTALEKVNSYGIYASSNNLQIIDNIIRYTGNTNGTVVNNAVRIEGDDEEGTPAKSVVVSRNIFDIDMPSVDIGYDPDTWASTVMNDAIVFYYCEDLEFVENVVKVKYSDVTTAYGYDSLYAVSVRSDAYTFGEVQSSNVGIVNNTIDIVGHSCVYPVYVCADNFAVTGNNVTSTSETYLAHGIDVDGPSAVGSVSENIIVAEAPLAAYGIYSYQYMGAIEDVTYVDNFIDVTAYGSAGMEIVECNPIITGNEITANGNYTYGIIASIRDEGIISDNMIAVLGSNTGADATGDGLMPKNSMGISVKGDCVIERNIVGSTNIGINLVEDGEINITGNTIDVEANALIDSYGIYSHGLSDVTIADNEIIFVGNTDGTVVNNAVRVEGDDDEDEPAPATGIVVSGNTFDVQMPSVDVGYDPDTWASTVMNDAIVFYYVDDLMFVGNDVNVEYNDVSTAYGYDSLYAVSVRSDAYTFGEVQSKQVIIENNTIGIEGHSCAYAVYVCADNFAVMGNNITSTSETYLAHGIDVDGPSAVGSVSENIIVAESPLAAYGIYSYQYMGAIENITYVDNVIDVTGYGSAGMEIVECNPLIAGNEITADGNYTYGIIASIRDEGIISDNMIAVLGSNEGSDATGDGLMPKNSMGISVKGNCLIEDNVVGSTNIGINLVEAGEFTITGNDIAVEANALIDSYGIYSKGLSNITITDNEIEFIGNTDGTVVNNAVRIAGDDDEDEPAPATGIVVSGNFFDIEMPSVDVGYDPDTWASTVMNDAIVFYYVEDLEFVGNDVKVEYNNVTTAYGFDSMYAVSVRSDAYSFGEIQSSDILIEDNTIELEGHACVYPVYVCADNFIIGDNNITATSETYLAHGIDVDGPSAVGQVYNNDIKAEAPLAAYGIYSYQYMGAIEDISYYNNTIDVTAYGSAGMEIVECNPTISGNEIIANGNYTYGIIASIRDEGIISDNTVVVLGSNEGSDPTGDGLMPQNSMGISVKGTSLIEENTIESTNIGINLVEEGQITIDNNVINVEANTGEIDNHAIVASEIEELIISNNEISYVGASTPKDDYKTAKAYAIYVNGSEVHVENNTIDAVVPSLPADWEEVPPGSWNYVRHAYTEGLVFDGCDFSSVEGNDITLTYDEGSYGSIYVIDVLGCDDFTVADNTIDATGESYIYGIIVEGDDFVIANNTISVSSENYACGIDIEESTGGIIDSNLIEAVAPESVYPIYGGMVGTPSVEITNNDIYGDSYYAVGIEFSGSDVTATDNTIELSGNHTIGIGVHVDELIAENNTIISEASNTGNVSIWDSLGTNTTGIKSTKGKAAIIGNEIKTTGKYSVEIDDLDGTVHDNYLVSEKLIGDKSVYSTGSASVYDNLPDMKVILLASDLIKAYDDGQLFVVTAVDENGDPMVSITLWAYVDDETWVGNTDEDGVVAFNIELPEGNYTVITEFEGDETYAPKTIENTLTVVPKQTEIIAPLFAEFTIIEVAEGDAYVELTLVDIDGNPLADYPLVIEIDGESDEYVTDENGTVIYDILCDEGEYNLTVEFAGDEFYAPTNATVGIYIFRIDSMINAPIFGEYTTVEVLAGNATIELTLTAVDGTPLVNQTVVIELDNVSAEFETDENGTIEYTIEALAGEYTIVMEFAGDEFYTESNATTEISIVPVESEIIAPVFDEFTTVDVAKGEAIIELTLFDIDGNPLAEQTVVIEVDNVSAEFITDENGTIEYAVYDALAGNYTIVMTFAGDEIYAGSNATTEISIVPVESQIIAPVFVQVTAVDVAEKSAIIDISLTDIDGNPLAKKPVIIEFNGVGGDFITDENGTVSYSLWGGAGDYKLIVKFDGDSWYSASNATADVSIVLVESEILAPVFAQFTTVDVAEGDSIINITLTDIDENPLANKTVFIGIDGGEGKYTTDENGAIQLLVLANAGEHTIAIEFAGDACYGPSNATTEISIVPVESQIVAPEYAEYTIVEVKEHNATFDLTLVDADGNPLANKDVIIELNGVGDHFTTDENGAVKYSLWGDAGNYTLIARFEGDECYTKSNATADIVITPVKTEIVADESAVYSIVDVVSGNATFDLTLVDADGNFLANKTIFITFNGVTEEFTTDENGTVEYAISAAAGNYTIGMAFENDGYYEASDASATVSIVKAESKIFLRNALYFVLETKMVRITMWDGNNNPVEGKIVHITIGNSTWSGVTDKNGDAYIRVGIGFGVHAATVHFDGDDEYAASNRSGFVRVIKETPSVMVRGDNTHFKVSDATKTVKVYLWDRTSKPLPANSKIAIKVNGQTYVGYTDNTGVASINLDINTAGTYNAEVKYAGNSAYNAVTTDVKFVIQ